MGVLCLICSVVSLVDFVDVSIVRVVRRPTCEPFGFSVVVFRAVLVVLEFLSAVYELLVTRILLEELVDCVVLCGDGILDVLKFGFEVF